MSPQLADAIQGTRILGVSLELLVGVTGFEPATPTSRKMSRGFRFLSWISPLQAKPLKIEILLFS